MILIQSRNRDTEVENVCMDIKEESGGGMNWEIGTDIYATIDTLYKTDK